MGKLVEIKNVFGTFQSTEKYEYNSKGNVSKIIFSDGGIETFYEYDDKPNFFSDCFYPKDLIKTTTDGNSSNNVTKWRDVGEDISSAEYTYNEKGYPVTIIMNNEGVKEKVKITYESY